MLVKNYTQLDLNRFKKTEKKHVPFQFFFFILLFMLTLSLTGFFFYQYQKSQLLLSQATLDNTPLLINMVGKLTILPQGETPSVATISNKDQLPDQAFFKSAQNGDKLLVFSKSKKAILYRPSVNKIVEVATISFEEQVSGASTTNLSPTPFQFLTPTTKESTPSAVLSP